MEYVAYHSVIWKPDAGVSECGSLDTDVMSRVFEVARVLTIYVLDIICVCFECEFMLNLELIRRIWTESVVVPRSCKSF